MTQSIKIGNQQGGGRINRLQKKEGKREKPEQKSSFLPRDGRADVGKNTKGKGRPPLWVAEVKKPLWGGQGRRPKRGTASGGSRLTA